MLDDYMQLNIFIKLKQCGKVFISRNKITYIISCGLNINKGNINIEEISFFYQKNKLLLVYHKNNKKLLKIRCSKETYDKILTFISYNPPTDANI